MEITKKKTTVVTEITKYKLHPTITLEETFVNGKPNSRKLKRTGKVIKKDGITLHFWLVYDPDLSFLEKTNPFWFYERKACEQWFKGKELPENPEDIDVSKIVLACSHDHSFYNVDMEPIPVVIGGDYIQGGISSRNYDLEKLHKYLSTHKQVKYISKIEEIPYYNNESGDEKCFEVLVLPTVKQLKEMGNRHDIFYSPWGEKKDYLGMEKFWINERGY
jgi:hypothetical protein